MVHFVKASGSLRTRSGLDLGSFRAVLDLSGVCAA